MKFSKNTLFFFIYTIFVLILSVSIYYIPKGNEILYLNHHHSAVLNQVFKTISFFGESITIVLLTLYLIIRNKELFKFWTFAFCIQLVFTQGLKTLFNAPRPLSYFPKGTLNPIENVPELLHKSMPSGHTASAFLIATFIILFLVKESKFAVFLLTISAIMIGISRIYLLAHFKEDILVGSLIGVLSAETSYFFLKRKSATGIIN